MRSNTFRVPAFAAGLVACALAPVACSDDAPPKSHLLDNADAAGGDSALPDGSPSGDTGAADSAPDASSDGGQGVCDPNATWGAGLALQGPSGDLSTSENDLLGAVTPDELSLAWTTDSSGQVLYADRSVSSQPFGAPKTLAGVSPAIDRVALSSDGLQLVVVDVGGKQLISLSRASRGDAFGSPDPTPFAAINSMAAQASSDRVLGDPLLSNDGLSLAYSFYSSSGASDAGLTATIYLTTRAKKSDAWTVGSALTAPDLAVAGDGTRRRPTGFSSDALTLFFIDESSGIERAAFRASTSSPFMSFVDVGSQLYATPSADCTTLYYSTPGTVPADAGVGVLPTLDLFSAKKN